MFIHTTFTFFHEILLAYKTLVFFIQETLHSLTETLRLLKTFAFPKNVAFTHKTFVSQETLFARKTFCVSQETWRSLTKPLGFLRNFALALKIWFPQGN